jgi:methylenetetrahydrofolate dehydrogenase (NADP+)/methenyltetrahydrofolate cyclohydrolase
VSATLLDGKAVAREISEEVRREVHALAARGLKPGLGVLLVGDNAASAIYVRSKTRACEDLGIFHETRNLPETTTTEAVVREVEAFNGRRDIHGILIQLPLPAQVDTARVLRSANPEKDVDGFHPENVGLLVQKHPRFVPCTPAGIMELLVRKGIPISGSRAVVLGRSDVVGKPLSLLLLHADATVTICHSRTRDLLRLTQGADILVAAMGKAGFVGADHVKEGAVVIDVGINRIENLRDAEELLDPARLEAFRQKGSAIVGDVRFGPVSRKVSAITPVPGGVGPLTIALLMKNTVKAASALV